MGQTKILPKNEVLRITGVSGKQYKTVQWHSSQIVMKPLLNMEEYINTVKNIVADCADANGDVAIELLDFSIRVHIISAYAFVELPEDINQLYYIAYQSDLYDTTVGVANKAQVESIRRSVWQLSGGGHYGKLR